MPIHLRALCAVSTCSPDHPMDVSLVVRLQLVVRRVARQQSVPRQSHAIADFFLTQLGWGDHNLAPSHQNVSEMRF